MRRMPRGTWVAVLAIVLAAACGGFAIALAQQTMTFHSMPAESVARLEDRQAGDRTPAPVIDIHVSGAKGQRGFELHVDSTGGRMNLPGTVAPPAPPAPIPPAPAEPGAGHETTGDIVRFLSSVDVPSGQVVQGDVVSVGGSVTVEGTVKGSVTSIGGDVTLESGARVDDDVVCLSGTLRQEPGASIGGQRVTAPRVPGGRFLLPMISVVSTGVRVVTHLVVMAILLLLAFLVIKLAPGRTRDALDTIRTEGGSSFLVGLAILGLLIPSLVVLALVVVILCITIIGIPLAIAVLFGYAVFLLVAFLWGMIVGYAVLGEHLHLRFRGVKPELVTAAFWGIFALSGLRIAGDLLHVVPVFGFLGGLMKVISVVTCWVLATLGAGSLVRTEYRRRTVQNWWMRSRPRRGGRVEDDFPPPPVPVAEAPAPPPAAAAPPPAAPAPPAPPGGEPPTTPIV
ncbi:MAG TPA: hypothetical protein VMH61_02685 [Candidatus Acidoferrales bacterium]|nr:hypothetical protein [Candidatus Acidoferrales bacterium]